MSINSIQLPAGLHIRPAIPTDTSFFQSLYYDSRTDLEVLNADKDFIHALKEQQYEAQLDSYGQQFPNAMYFILERHSDPIGRAIIDFGHNEVRLVDILLLPVAQGKGFGKAVIQSFMHCADQVGAPMTLTVMRNNVAAKALYSQLGFIVESMDAQYEFMAYYPKTVSAMTI